MRCSKAVASIGLLVGGVILALANLWFAAARSTIPLQLDTRVTTKEQRPEKHRGIDDVYLLKLAGGRELQVDKEVYDFAAEGATLSKRAWSRQLRSGEEEVKLQWSRDVHGMLAVMPITIAAMFVLCRRCRGTRDA